MVLRIGVARVLRGGVAGSARVVLAEPARGVLDPIHLSLPPFAEGCGVIADDGTPRIECLAQRRTCKMLVGWTSSKADSLAVRRPSIDDLVAIARSAGRARTTKRTICHWVERDLVDGPVRLGRDPRYPLRTVGQVDTLARRPIRTHGIEMVRFALFIETDSIPVTDALKIAATRIDAMRTEVSTSREQATRDPKLLRAEVKRAAQLRGRNSVLPREVRMSLAERERALAQLVGLALGVHVDGVPAGMDAIERVLGLRSGRTSSRRLSLRCSLYASGRIFDALDAPVTIGSICGSGFAELKVTS